MTLLTMGGSLLSLLPSEVLLSEVGEYSLFWAEVRNQNEVKKLLFLFTTTFVTLRLIREAKIPIKVPINRLIYSCFISAD